MWFGTCASCLLIGVWTHLRKATALLNGLRGRVTWIWFGTCASCLRTKVWTHVLYATTLFDMLQTRVI